MSILMIYVQKSGSFTKRSIKNMVSNEELFKAERAATDSIVNAFETLIDRQNKLAERVDILEREISDLHLKIGIAVVGGND